MSRLVKHKEEKQPREKPQPKQHIPKAKPSKVIQEVQVQPEPAPKSKRNGVILACCIAFISLSGIIFTFANVNAQIDSGYISDARPIYNSGYDDASSDVWYNETTDQNYQKQFEFLQLVGGYTGETNDKHYIPNIDSNDGINATEKKLIYAAGYTNGFTDSMVHGYNTQRNNIPE